MPFAPKSKITYYVLSNVFSETGHGHVLSGRGHERWYSDWTWPDMVYKLDLGRRDGVFPGGQLPMKPVSPISTNPWEKGMFLNLQHGSMWAHDKDHNICEIMPIGGCFQLPTETTLICQTAEQAAGH